MILIGSFLAKASFLLVQSKPKIVCNELDKQHKQLKKQRRKHNLIWIDLKYVGSLLRCLCPLDSLLPLHLPVLYSSPTPTRQRSLHSLHLFCHFPLNFCDFPDPGRYFMSCIFYLPVWFAFLYKVRVRVMSEDEELFPWASFYVSGKKEEHIVVAMWK